MTNAEISRTSYGPIFWAVKEIGCVGGAARPPPGRCLRYIGGAGRVVTCDLAPEPPDGLAGGVVTKTATQEQVAELSLELVERPVSQETGFPRPCPVGRRCFVNGGGGSLGDRLRYALQAQFGGEKAPAARATVLAVLYPGGGKGGVVYEPHFLEAGDCRHSHLVSKGGVAAA